MSVLSEEKNLLFRTVKLSRKQIRVVLGELVIPGHQLLINSCSFRARIRAKQDGTESENIATIRSTVAASSMHAVLPVSEGPGPKRKDVTAIKYSSSYC